MSYFAGLLQGRIESRSAARSAQEWKEIALRLEADLKEAQLAALAIDILLAVCSLAVFGFP